MERCGKYDKLVWLVTTTALLLPLLIDRIIKLLPIPFEAHGVSIILPMGCAFYTMQIIAYLTDVYTKKVCAQKNFFRYLLFISWFPQIIQGPIPHYNQLYNQFICKHSFSEKNFIDGFQLILWGFFLKMVIADRMEIVVSRIFDYFPAYQGIYVLLAGMCYSIQLYTDFLACVTLSRGISILFGIRLENNFARPYLSCSVRDFWRRWHISLSSWLRDYIYIPLGGNRKGVVRKYLYLVLTFTISGLWHGRGWRFVIWGLIHACYQITGSLTRNGRDRLCRVMALSENDLTRRIIQNVSTSFFIMLAWIIFRAETLKKGIDMIWSIFTVRNIWILFDRSLPELGLSFSEWNILIVAVLLLLVIGLAQEKGVSMSKWIRQQHFILRCLIYTTGIIVILVYGVYGYGYQAADFIYGGF